MLAEETISGRTVRTVDSSLERMQVKIIRSSTTESRYVVACNGRSVPLQTTGEAGEASGGRALSRPQVVGMRAPHNSRARAACLRHRSIA